ncbi:MAG TPA: hypothetical protein VH394_25095 [Thermoanaerobaculia bacterium]|jgi:hypothetical protein|nr:hypothetical protein [Thermoanaerobaculia bacterium]
MSKIHIGPHTHPEEPDPHPPTRTLGTFDREINLRGIVYTVVVLVAVALVCHLLVWGLLKGFASFDTHRDPAPSPLAEANRQPPPSGPRLQTTPELDLHDMRAEEDRKLGGAGWVNQQQGTVHVPIDVAMEVIAGRGLGPEVVGGTPGGFPTASSAPTAPGALVEMSRQPSQATTAQPPQERR